MEQNKEKWVEERIASLDKMQMVKAPEHLYSSVMMRVRAKPFATVKMSIRMLSGAAAALALLIGLNIFSWVSYCRAVDSSNSLQNIATDYGLNSNTYSY